jgi:glutamate/tyrosine decarboxylase-like PLP-dependent enzyme
MHTYGRRLSHVTAGLERADSLAFDLHKWVYLPLEIACVLIRHGDAHINTFTGAAPYLASMNNLPPHTLPDILILYRWWGQWNA